MTLVTLLLNSLKTNLVNSPIGDSQPLNSLRKKLEALHIQDLIDAGMDSLSISRKFIVAGIKAPLSDRPDVVLVVGPIYNCSSHKYDHHDLWREMFFHPPFENELLVGGKSVHEYEPAAILDFVEDKTPYKVEGGGLLTFTYNSWQRSWSAKIHGSSGGFGSFSPKLLFQENRKKLTEELGIKETVFEFPTQYGGYNR